MKICIICEGSYPYVTGGVSSWVNMLIKSMPEHEFIIYSIGALEEMKGIYKYQLPENLIKVEEVFLDSIYNISASNGYKQVKIEAYHVELFKKMILGEELNWIELVKFIRNLNMKNITDIFMSKEFFNMLGEVCKDKYQYMPFNEFFWTIRSMLLPFIYLSRNPIPEADVYHSVSAGYGGLIGAIGSYEYKKPYLLTEHGIYAREREEEIIKAKWVKGQFKDEWIHFFYGLANLSYQVADQVVTLFGVNRHIEIELGCDPDKIKIIPNGIEVANFKEVRDDWEKDGTFNIGAVVRVVPIKDIKTMISAFSIVKRKIKNAKLYIMGPTDEDYEYFKECKKLVKDLETQDVVFTGGVNIKEYIGNMEILLLSSISEGQPLALLEGMAAKKPFVATRVGSCEELLYGMQGDTEGQAGFVVPIMGVEEMAEAILTLAKDKKECRQMGINGFNRVSKYYKMEGFIDGYKKIYRELGRK